ncbi:MAG: YbaB/EbfC family nucleoid-associated protein [Bdellovibrionales bacterium]|nr:YbaB/EbfC family nucleoid-associated protein [Bdellovibrionales bacterium]
MAKGFNGFPGNMQEMMKQAQKMQENLLKVQEEAQGLTAEGSSGGGMVTVVANGANQIVSMKIEKEVVDPSDIEMLQDLIVAASNEALKSAQEQVKKKMASVTGGLNIPGLS